MAPQGIHRGEIDDSEAIVEAVIAAAGGDVRKAILGLVRGQHQIEGEIRSAVSAGYVRRGFGGVH